MTEEPQPYKQIHGLYCLLTGLDLPYDNAFHASDWFLFCKRFDVDDLRLVVGHIKTRYKAPESHEIMLSMMRFTYLIRQLDTFAELLSEAKAMHKKPATERQKVLGATGRTEQEVGKPTRKAGDVANRVLRGQEFLDAMKALRESID